MSREKIPSTDYRHHHPWTMLTTRKKNCSKWDKSKLVRQWADYVCWICVRACTNGNLMEPTLPLSLSRFKIKQSKLPHCKILRRCGGERAWRKIFDSMKLSHHYKDHLVENWIFTTYTFSFCLRDFLSAKCFVPPRSFGMCVMFYCIFKHIGWKIKGTDNLNNHSSRLWNSSYDFHAFCWLSQMAVIRLNLIINAFN